MNSVRTPEAEMLPAKKLRDTIVNAVTSDTTFTSELPLDDGPVDPNDDGVRDETHAESGQIADASTCEVGDQLANPGEGADGDDQEQGDDHFQCRHDSLEEAHQALSGDLHVNDLFPVCEADCLDSRPLSGSDSDDRI